MSVILGQVLGRAVYSIILGWASRCLFISLLRMLLVGRLALFGLITGCWMCVCGSLKLSKLRCEILDLLFKALDFFILSFKHRFLVLKDTIICRGNILGRPCKAMKSDISFYYAAFAWWFWFFTKMLHKAELALITFKVNTELLSQN